MSKNKANRRKARLKAKKQQLVLNERNLSVRLSVALEKLCEPILSEYIDDSTGPDLIGRRIAWQLGRIAWNIAVTGCRDLASEALHSTRLDAEQQMMVQDEIIGLIQRKYTEFSNFRTAIRDFTVLLVDGVPSVKVRPGDTFPAMPQLPTSNERRLHAGSASGVTSESISSLRKSLKLSQIRFGELVGVSSRKVSAWEHGKAIPTAEQKDKICNIARDLKKIDAQ